MILLCSISSLAPIEDIRVEMDWMCETAFFHDRLASKITFPREAAKEDESGDLQLLTAFTEALGLKRGFGFSVSDVEKHFGMSDSDAKALIDSWSREGAVCQLPEGCFSVMPCDRLRDEIRRCIKRAGGVNGQQGLHPRFIWKCLQTDGFGVSFKAVSALLEAMLINTEGKDCNRDGYILVDGLIYYRDAPKKM